MKDSWYPRSAGYVSKQRQGPTGTQLNTPNSKKYRAVIFDMILIFPREAQKYVLDFVFEFEIRTKIPSSFKIGRIPINVS